MNDDNLKKFLDDAFTNPIHGKYGEEKQLDLVIRNNIIIIDYINNIWNNFKNYFNKN